MSQGSTVALGDGHGTRVNSAIVGLLVAVVVRLGLALVAVVVRLFALIIAVVSPGRRALGHSKRLGRDAALDSARVDKRRVAVRHAARGRHRGHGGDAAVNLLDGPGVVGGARRVGYGADSRVRLCADGARVARLAPAVGHGDGQHLVGHHGLYRRHGAACRHNGCGVLHALLRVGDVCEEEA